MKWSKPWFRNDLPWYKKIYRVFHCTVSMMGHAVYMQYLNDDLDYLIAEMKKKL